VVHAANGDITAYLPTNIMSITDGQWILDMEMFRSGIRPSVSMGLSVTRAGGVGHNKRQKDFAAKTLKTLADFRQAEEFSHFGSELAVEAKRALNTGKRVFEMLTQGPGDTYSLTAQQLMFDLVLNLGEGEELNMEVMKQKANEMAAQITSDDQYDAVRDQFKALCLVELKGVPSAKPAPAEPTADSAPAPDTATAEAPQEANTEQKPEEKSEDKPDKKSKEDKKAKKEPAEAKK